MLNRVFICKIYYLCARLVLFTYSSERIKRESGEIPEQSRCCEAPFKLFGKCPYH